MCSHPVFEFLLKFRFNDIPMRNHLIRPVKVRNNYVKHAEGSCLFSMGYTQVLCVASVENRRPPHAEEKNIGWLSAESNWLRLGSL